MAARMEQLEEIILTCTDYEVGSDLPEIVKLFLQGQYEEILASTLLSKFVLGHRDDCTKPSPDFCNFIKQNVEQLISQQQENVEMRDLSILIVAVSCLQLFSQNNFLGPPTSKSPLQFCHDFFHDKVKVVENEALNELSIDGDIVYSRARHLIYLYLAKIILLECRSFFTHIQTWDWWLMRSLLLQQSLLSEKSPTLKATVIEILDDLSKKEPLMTDSSNRDIQIMFHVEAGHSCHIYFEYKRAAEHFNTAKKIGGIEVQLTGVMGKRTRYQQEDKAQLILKVERKEVYEKSEQSVVRPSALPKNLPLDDDTVLNDIKFADGNSMETVNLSPVELSLVLGLMESYRRSMAQGRLTDEEVLTYLSYILSEANNWSVSVVSLNLRSKLERDSRRRVERSMMQLEELAKIAGTPNSFPDISHRIPLFYSSRVPPIWSIQRELASLLLSLGCIGDALDVFEKLEMWEDVIACYQKLGKREKAETLIRERLAIKETPSLLCYLGDVTREMEHYQRAWELSGHRNARSQRCMGYLYFHEEKYEEAIKSFATSLEINSLQTPVWFTYGCAAMACQKFDVGTMAFRRCVIIDYDNFEAWSNLATCHVKLHQKQKAYATLQDALKCNFENWRLWENSLIIGTDCGEFEDVIQSYHRLMDLKEKWIDVEVLNILTRAVIENIPDANGNPAGNIGGRLLELFGRITSKVTSEGEIWANYAKLTNIQIKDKEPDLEKALQYLQKAYRCFTQKVGWEKDLESCKKVVEHSVNLSDSYVQCSKGKSQQESLRLLSAAKLMLKGALVKIQRQHTDPITQELPSNVTEMCQRMETKLSDVTLQVDALKTV